MTWSQVSLPAPAEDHVRLLATTVAPLLDRLRADGVIQRGFYLRELGGDGGQRVLAQVVPTPGADLAARVGELGHPGATVGPATVVPLTGPVFDGPDLGPVTREFFAAASPLISDVLARGGHSAVLSAALDLLAGHVQGVSGARAPGQATLPEGLPLSYLSLLSHAEAFIATSKDPDAVRGALRGRYAAMREGLDARVSAIFTQLRGGATESTDAQAWHDLVRATKPALVERFTAGTLVAHTAYSQVQLRERTDFVDNTFHRTAGGLADLQEYLCTDTSFLATRLLTSLLYLGLHTLGVTLPERYLLCFCVASACESIFDVDGVTLLSTIAGQTV